MDIFISSLPSIAEVDCCGDENLRAQRLGTAVHWPSVQGQPSIVSIPKLTAVKRDTDKAAPAPEVCCTGQGASVSPGLQLSIGCWFCRLAGTIVCVCVCVCVC